LFSTAVALIYIPTEYNGSFSPTCLTALVCVIDSSHFGWNEVVWIGNVFKNIYVLVGLGFQLGSQS
jgi:hypothetical protein